MKTINFPRLLAKLPLNTICSAVRNLRTLKLRSIYFDEYEIDYHGYHQFDEEYGLSCFRDQDNIDSNGHQALGEMLQLAYHLDELTFMFIDDYREHHDRLLTPLTPLNTLRGLNRLPSLLSSAKFRIGENQLVQFLLVIAKTLQYIKVGALVIDYGTWASTFKKLRGELPRLETFRVKFRGRLDAGLNADKPYDVDTLDKVTISTYITITRGWHDSEMGQARIRCKN